MDTHIKMEGFFNTKKIRQTLNWWVSVGVKYSDPTNILIGEKIGIDFEIKNLAVCSGRTKYGNIYKTKTAGKLEKKKRRLQRSVSRSCGKNKKKGKYCKTSNVTKKGKKLLRIHHRLANIHTNHIPKLYSSSRVHQITIGIIKRKSDFVYLKDLNVSVAEMMKNQYLGKVI